MSSATTEPEAEEESLVEGMRIGRFVVIRDVEGNRPAVAAAAVAALCETDDGTLLMLPGWREPDYAEPVDRGSQQAVPLATAEDQIAG